MSRKVIPLEIVEVKTRNGKSYPTFRNKRKRSPTAPITRPTPRISPPKEEPNDLNDVFDNQWPDMEPTITNKKVKTKKASGRVMLIICSYLAPI
jgi:hypothetical protein